MGFAAYVTKQTFVSSKCQVVYVEECVTQAAFESFTEEGINPGLRSRDRDVLDQELILISLLSILFFFFLGRPLQTRIISLHFATNDIGLSSFKFVQYCLFGM